MSNSNSLQLPTASSSNNKNNGNMPPPALPTVALPAIEVPKIELEHKKEKNMAEFLAMMDNYAPVVNTTNAYHTNTILNS